MRTTCNAVRMGCEHGKEGRFAPEIGVTGMILAGSLGV